MLNLKNIKKNYKTGSFTQAALDDVSLNFREQEFVAVLGQSGAGKTTLLNIIGGLDKYDSGDLVINGKSTADFSARDWDAYRNNSIGFVFQGYNLIPHLSVLDNVELGMTLSGVSTGDRRPSALATLEKVGLKDHVNKKPAQLSGGQMQRVAIARALANDPDIILADEPTGALDTTTSSQILDLIKEIARDKLVIMVTHNAELAKKYATRTVEFSDGQVISDTSPYNGLPNKKEKDSYVLKRTAMSYLTALRLSWKNITTKKGRTALTAFASSIGIVGIALIMSLGNGLQRQIEAFQEGSLAEFPILIQRDAFTMGGGVGGMQDQVAIRDLDYRTDSEFVYPFVPTFMNMFHTNIFSDEFMEHLLAIDPDLVGSIGYTRSVGMNLLRDVDGEVMQVSLQSGAVGMMGSIMEMIGMGAANMAGMGAVAKGLSTFPETLAAGEPTYLARNYELLAGRHPEHYTNLVLIVDDYNRVNISVLTELGFDREFLYALSFDEIVGTELRLIPNDDFYARTDLGTFTTVADLNYLYGLDSAVTLTIVGIFRSNADTGISLMNPGVVFSDALIQSIIDREFNSEIATAQRYSGLSVLDLEPLSEHDRRTMLMYFGGYSRPSGLLIFPRNFEAQAEVIAHIEYFNDYLTTHSDYRIIFNNQADFVVNTAGILITAVTGVLIGFSAISLVVALIMIAIIIYISVVERTKEIGILRALGARKKDITRVFNAETLIIGMCSGTLAISTSYLLIMGLNGMVYLMASMENIAILYPQQALLLLALSLVMTLIGGFIPARMAAKKDPVVALRVE